MKSLPGNCAAPGLERRECRRRAGGGVEKGGGEKAQEQGGVSIQQPITGKKQLAKTGFKRYMLGEVSQQGEQELEQVHMLDSHPEDKQKSHKGLN